MNSNREKLPARVSILRIVWLWSRPARHSIQSPQRREDVPIPSSHWRLTCWHGALISIAGKRSSTNTHIFCFPDAVFLSPGGNVERAKFPPPVGTPFIRPSIQFNDQSKNGWKIPLNSGCESVPLIPLKTCICSLTAFLEFSLVEAFRKDEKGTRKKGWRDKHRIDIDCPNRVSSVGEDDIY